MSHHAAGKPRNKDEIDKKTSPTQGSTAGAAARAPLQTLGEIVRQFLTTFQRIKKYGLQIAKRTSHNK